MSFKTLTTTDETLDHLDDQVDVEDPSRHPEETDETDTNELPTHSSDGRLIIRAKPSERRLIHARVLESLAATGKFYEQEGTMVYLHKDSLSGEISIRQVNTADLQLALDEVVVWERLFRGEFVRADPPEQFCNTLLRARVEHGLPALTGLARQPFFREDGTVCMSPGYDPATGLYGAFQASGWSIPASPSREDAEAALDTLAALLEEFPFGESADRSAALAAILTAAVRPALPTAPMVHVRAFAPGTGKSFLCAVISSFATPRTSAPQSFPSSNDECDKVLLALLKQGSAVIEFDNLTSDIIPFKKLCTVLTSERMSGRVLGSSKTLDVSTRSLILSSGNNVGPVGDMVRRCITINLDARVEAPASRKFENPNLLHQLRQRRSSYVAAALTIIRAWLVAGMPKAACPPLNSFERWSDWCRQPLLWLGLEDPVASVHKAHEEDPDRQLLQRLLTVWQEVAGSKPVMVKELVTWADPTGPHGAAAADIRELLEDIASSHGRPIDRRRLGWWLKHRTGHVVNGMRLELVPRSLNAQSWRVSPV